MHHNPLIGFYLASWQSMLQNAAKGQAKEVWRVPKPDIFEPESIAKLGAIDMQNALAGYRLWQGSAALPSQPMGEFIWQEGATKLFDLGGTGKPLMLIPSMINSFHILDLPAASLAAYLRRAGFCVFLLDWGKIRHCKRALGLEGYQMRLARASLRLGAHDLIGYCLGGTIAHLARPPNCQKMVLFGAPWRFQHDSGQIGLLSRGLAGEQNGFLQDYFGASELLYGVLPSLVIDHFFAQLNPLSFVQKFRDRANLQTPALFDQVEHWLNSGRDLPLPFARDLMDVLQKDSLTKLRQSSKIPTLAIYGQKDHICPPQSAKAILSNLAHGQSICHDAGHVGLLIGSRSRKNIWPQIVNFLQDQNMRPIIT